MRLALDFWNRDNADAERIAYIEGRIAAIRAECAAIDERERRALATAELRGVVVRGSFMEHRRQFPEQYEPTAIR